MAYTDGGLVVYEFGTLTGGAAPVQVETAADILALRGRGANEATGTDNILDSVGCPGGFEVVEFCVELTEAITNADATHHIVKLQTLTKPGASAVTALTMTLPKDSTEATAATVAIGARIKHSGVPVHIAPGSLFYVEVTQAAGAAGGAYRAFVIGYHRGYATADAAGNSPVWSVSA